MLLLQNGSYILESLRIGFGVWDSYLTLFDFANYFTIHFVVILVAIILITFNLTLFWKFVEQQRAVQLKSEKKNHWFIGLGMFIIMLGMQCLSCGAAILGGLVSLSFLAVFPHAGLYLNLVGLAILLYATYRLIKKINTPYVC